MKKVKLSVEISNIDNEYHYRGIANINKDIIKYETLNEEVIFDTRIDRLIKKEKDKKISIDFKNKIMNIEYLSTIINFDIKVYEYAKKEESIYASYSIDDKTIIELNINIIDYLGKEV